MATEHEYRSAYEGLQIRYVAHVDRLDGEIKELQQRLAKLEAAGKKLCASVFVGYMEMQVIGNTEAYDELRRVLYSTSSPGRGTEEGE